MGQQAPSTTYAPERTTDKTTPGKQRRHDKRAAHKSKAPKHRAPSTPHTHTHVPPPVLGPSPQPPPPRPPLLHSLPRRPCGFDRPSSSLEAQLCRERANASGRVRALLCGLV
eukprot:3453616-Rhodomonas_salina.3